MLSRIAESLYWIGRYCERAEDTARLLDVHFHLLLEDHADESAACQTLLSAMGVDEFTGTVDAGSVTALLTDDLAFDGSIGRSLAGAWENARGAREVISSETWETLNTTYQAFPDRARRAGERGRHDLYRWVKERCSILTGLVETTMSRDDGYCFLAVGRGLERVDMTTRLLAARYAETWGPTGWTTTLRCCAAYEAYARTYRRAVDATSAVEFLLLDRLFPRSVFHALDTAAARLAELDPRSSRAGVDDDARRRLGRLCGELEYLRIDDVLADLPRVLASLQSECALVHEAVARRYFRETQAVEWSR